MVARADIPTVNNLSLRAPPAAPGPPPEPRSCPWPLSLRLCWRHVSHWSLAMRKRSSTTVAACCATAAAALLALFPSSSTGFLVPVHHTPAAPALLLHTSGSRTGRLSKSPVHARSGSFSHGFGLGGRPPAASALEAAGRRSRRRSQATRTSMVFGGGGGGRGGGGGFRLDPGTVGTIVFGLLFVFAPGFIFGAFNTLFLVREIGKQQREERFR